MPEPAPVRIVTLPSREEILTLLVLNAHEYTVARLIWLNWVRIQFQGVSLATAFQSCMAKSLPEQHTRDPYERSTDKSWEVAAGHGRH